MGKVGLNDNTDRVVTIICVILFALSFAFCVYRYVHYRKVMSVPGIGGMVGYTERGQNTTVSISLIWDMIVFDLNIVIIEDSFQP